ncbi:hypothetical protein [Allofournierella massiliensis]|uniref:hypothetical protein n=1 Tax=Allofournierella massiliensis TaxID=1650663 RepID=UPI0039A0A530
MPSANSFGAPSSFSNTGWKETENMLYRKRLYSIFAIILTVLFRLNAIKVCGFAAYPTNAERVLFILKKARERGRSVHEQNGFTGGQSPGPD